MRIAFNALILVVAAGLGLGVGLLFRGKPKARMGSQATIRNAANQFQSKLKSKRQLKTELNDSSPLTTKLERDLSMSSGVTRWLYWLDALEKATPQDFPRLARLAQGHPPALRFVS